MRLLVVTPHFFGAPKTGEPYSYASQSDLIGRIAAVNAMMVALNRHFGSRRQGSRRAFAYPATTCRGISASSFGAAAGERRQLVDRKLLLPSGACAPSLRRRYSPQCLRNSGPAGRASHH